MTTFALVHGAWHGGWALSAVEPELEARGHPNDASAAPGVFLCDRSLGRGQSLQPPVGNRLATDD
jgi:hypothetical protein